MIESPPISEEKVWIQYQDQEQEGILAYPESGEPDTTALFLSPHPHLGGNMQNNVVRHLAQRFAQEGAATLRFNYHGVGESTIELPEGVSLFDYWARLERERRYDELLPGSESAYHFLQSTVPAAKKRVVVGYSLGAILALQLAHIETVTHIAGISPPILKVAELPPVKGGHISQLFIGGDRDFSFDPDAFEKILDASNVHAPLERIADCDHFFRRREGEIFRILEDWIGVQP